MEQYQKEITSVAFIILVMLSMGTVFYHNIEGWTLIDSLYFSTTTLTTVGYGDITPSKPETRLFTVFYILTGVGVILSSLSILGSHYIQRSQPTVEKAVVEKLEKNVIEKVKQGTKQIDDKYHNIMQKVKKKER